MDPFLPDATPISSIPSAFNVRVYGVLRDGAGRVLVSDEFIRGFYATKFPGGGLEFGEGTRDCLEREFLEETGLRVKCGSHIYTTDFYQVSAFNPAHQIISIYYEVLCDDSSLLVVHEKPFDFKPDQTADPRGESEVFRWMPLNELSEESVTLPIDKVVVRLLLKV